VDFDVSVSERPRSWAESEQLGAALQPAHGDVLAAGPVLAREPHADRVERLAVAAEDPLGAVGAEAVRLRDRNVRRGVVTRRPNSGQASGGIITRMAEEG
jgi:hypothetical protein